MILKLLKIIFDTLFQVYAFIQVEQIKLVQIGTNPIGTNIKGYFSNINIHF